MPLFSVSRKQWVEVNGFDPTFTWNPQPVVGNILVVAAFMRQTAYAEDFSISGVGWTPVFEQEINIFDNQTRRTIVIWQKIVTDPNEPLNVTVEVRNPGGGVEDCLVLAQEFEGSEPVDWTLLGTAENQDLSDSPSPLSTGETDYFIGGNILTLPWVAVRGGQDSFWVSCEFVDAENVLLINGQKPDGFTRNFASGIYYSREEGTFEDTATFSVTNGYLGGASSGILAYRPDFSPYRDFPQDWEGWKISARVAPVAVDADLSEFTLQIDQDFNPIFREPDNFLNLQGPRPAKADGSDIRITEDQQGYYPLPFDIIDYQPAATPTELSTARIRVALKRLSISSSLPSMVWVWWGQENAAAIDATDPRGQYNAYDASCLMFSHLGGALTPDDDRTSFQRTGTPSDPAALEVAPPPVPLIGQFATRVDVSDYLEIDPASAILLPGELTFTFAHYFIPGSPRDSHFLVSRSGGSSRSYIFIPRDTSTLQLYAGGNNLIASLPNSLVANQWNFIAVRRDAGGTYHLTVNSQVVSAPGGTYTIDGAPLQTTLGRLAGDGRAPLGWTTSMAVFNQDKGAAWVNATRDLLFSNQAYISWGYIFDPLALESGMPEFSDVYVATDTHTFVVEDGDDITTGPWEIQAPVFYEIHNFEVQDVVTGIPLVEASIIFQTHNFEQQGFATGEVEVNDSFIYQTHNFADQEGIECGAVELDESIIFQTHNFIRETFTLPSPVIDESVIHQTHNFEDQEGISTEAPVINDSFIWQLHKVGTGEDVVTGAPVFDPETLFIHQTHNFIQEGFSTGEPVLNDSFIHQTHHIEDQEEFTANTPVLEDAFMGKGHLIFTDDLIAEPADLGEPSIFEKHHFDSLDITWFQPELGESTIRATHKFQAEGFATGAPSIEIGVVVYQSLHPDDIVWEAPIIGEAELGQGHLIKEERITTRMPKVGESDIAQTHKDLKPRDIPRFLVVGGVRFEPKLGEPTLRTEHPLQSVDLATDEPEIGNPELTVVFHFDAEGIETDVPVVNESTLTHVYVFDTENIIGEAAVLDSVTIRQEHKVQGDGFATDLPYIDTSEIGVRFLLGGDGITAGPVYLGQPELTLSFALEPAFITWEEPSLGQPDVSQAHNLRPRRRRLQAPILGTPFYRMKETQDLIARGFRTGIPQVNTSGIDGMTEPAPPKTPTAGIDPTAVEVHHDIQIVKQIGYLRRYSPEEIRDTWHQTGALQAESDYTHVYGGGGIYQIIDPDSDLHEAIVLFMQPRFWKIDWSKYRMKGMSPHPQHVETGQRLEFVYVLLTRQEWKALEGEVNEDFESFYVRRERIPLITG